ncbi:MAG: MFS transporter [Desulfobacteraceae bacterium]|jgi:EmrB/QacA subfamily drug resistance transporter
MLRFPAKLCHTSQERSALFVTTLTSFVGPLMLSAVHVALPAIQRDLSVDAVGLSWIANAYLLAVAVFLVPMGRLADIHGRKRIFCWGLMISTAASTLTVFVPTLAWLLIMRVAQGLGAAMFVTTGMAILISVFPPQRRGRAIGIYVAAVYLGFSAGPFLGGLLTQHLGWRSVFGMMLPLGGICVAVTLRSLKEEWADARGEPFDWAGSTLYALALFFLVFGATRLPALSGVFLLAAGLVMLIGFVKQELRTAFPVFEVTLFRSNRVFAFSSLAALINYSATFAITFLLSLYLQYLKGFPPQTTGLVLMVQPSVQALFSPIAGKLSERIQPRLLATTGMSLTALGLGVFVMLDTRTDHCGEFDPVGVRFRSFFLTQHERHHGQRGSEILWYCFRRGGHHAIDGADDLHGHCGHGAGPFCRVKSDRAGTL